MAIETNKLKLSKSKYAKFEKDFAKGKFGNAIYGAAFYSEFGLHRISDQAQLLNINAKDGDAAKRLILNIFTFN